MQKYKIQIKLRIQMQKQRRARSGQQVQRTIPILEEKQIFVLVLANIFPDIEQKYFGKECASTKDNTNLGEEEKYTALYLS